MTQPLTQPDYGSYRWFCRGVGRYLEIGTDWNLWDHQQEYDVDEIIQRGLEQYYNPPPIDAIPGGYSWSFLEPQGSLTTAAGIREYDLPEDFDRFTGSLCYSESDGNDYPAVKITSYQRMLALESQTDFTTWPTYAATKPKAADGTVAQYQVVVVHPTPDAAYELVFRYHALARSLSDDHPFPLGGRNHTEGILASCLAVAEETKEAPGGRRWQRFMERLGAGIANDLKRAPMSLGYNGNRKGVIAGRGTLRDEIYHTGETYNGVSYTA